MDYRGSLLFGLAALTLLLAACGGASAGDSARRASGVAGLEIEPLPRGTPGSRLPSHVAAADPQIAFTRVTLIEGSPAIEEPTALALGPDGRLYVGQVGGRISALTLKGQAVTDVEVIVPAGALDNVLGLAFNPADGRDAPLYVSHTQLFLGPDGPAYAGRVSRVAPPDYEPEPVISGLPVSAGEHGTNSIAFDERGRLFIMQGGTTNAGVPSERHPRAETPLSGAILIAGVNDDGFDGRITYDPPARARHDTDQETGDVRVYASGFRNPFDLVLHSNGRIYATDNGPNEDGARSKGCDAEGSDPVEPDELNLIIEGDYYGHANRNRGRDDERQCVYSGPHDDAGDSTAPIATLGYFVSANGLAEYTSRAFGGRMQGDLIYVEWVNGRVWRVALAEDGTSVDSVSRLTEDVLDQPLDVVVGPDGTVYVAEMGAHRITAFVPKTLELGRRQ